MMRVYLNQLGLMQPIDAAWETGGGPTWHQPIEPIYPVDDGPVYTPVYNPTPVTPPVTTTPAVPVGPVTLATGTTQTPSTQICTADAKVCPDGSTVGRTGPNCTFPECPPASSEPAITPPGTEPASSSIFDIFNIEVSEQAALFIGLGVAGIALILMFGGSKR